MIGADLEGADPESRAARWAGVVSQYTGNAAVMQPELETVLRESSTSSHIGRRFLEHAPGLYVPIRRHHRQRRPRSNQDNKPGTITIRATGKTQPARLRQLSALENTEASGKSRSTCTSRCRSSQEGLLRHLASPPPRFGHVPHPLAVA